MPKLNDQEPILDADGKVLYENEWDRIRSMYFTPRRASVSDIDPLERLDRQQRKRTIHKR